MEINTQEVATNVHDVVKAALEHWAKQSNKWCSREEARDHVCEIAERIYAADISRISDIQVGAHPKNKPTSEELEKILGEPIGVAEWRSTSGGT